MTKLRFALVLVTATVGPSTATPFDNESTVRAMKDELAHSMNLERAGVGKPYFIAYSVWDLQTIEIRADFGALISSVASARRSSDVDVRVGDYTLDSSNVLDPRAAENPVYQIHTRTRHSLPTRPDYDADRHALWVATWRDYEHAATMLARKQALVKTTVASFSKETPVRIVDTQLKASPDRARLEHLAKKLSAVFRSNPDAHTGSVSIGAITGKQYFVSSEGAASVRPVSLLKVEVSCSSRADDGMPITDSIGWFVTSIDELPGEAELVRQVGDLSRELSAVRVAPIAVSYIGPVLFEGVAAGQVVRALLAESLVGTPPRAGGGTGRRAPALRDTELAGDIGRQIVPAGTSIVDDPTLTRIGTSSLVGGYRFDAEGVPAQRTVLVENGVLKQFLMSRTPRQGFDRSNGHATSKVHRASLANLVVSSTKALSNTELRKRAAALAKEWQLEYVVVVERFANDGFDRAELDRDLGPPASLLPPTVAKRVYADGRIERMRGARVTPKLKQLVGVGAQPVVYSWGRNWSTYFTSIAAPSLLFRETRVDYRAPDLAEPTSLPRPKPP
jgi:TldD protein